MKKLILVILAVILLSGCAIHKPTRSEYKSNSKYEKELKQYYEKTKVR